MPWVFPPLAVTGIGAPGRPWSIAGRDAIAPAFGLAPQPACETACTSALAVPAANAVNIAAAATRTAMSRLMLPP